MSNVHSSVMFSSSAIAEEGAPFLIIDELQRGGEILFWADALVLHLSRVCVRVYLVFLGGGICFGM